MVNNDCCDSVNSKMLKSFLLTSSGVIVHQMQTTVSSNGITLVIITAG